MLNVKVRNMQSKNGNDMPNQFVITTKDGEYFQSYQTIICFVDNDRNIFLDESWDNTNTTNRFRCDYLGINKTQTLKRIASKDFTVMDLNPEEI